jgi:ketosteroid isomerase-like protein
MAEPGYQGTTTFEQEIARLNRESVAAFNRGDVAVCAGFYAEDATMLLPERPPVRGRMAIEDCLTEYAASGVRLMPVEPIEIVSGGDIGCCAGTYLFEARSPP